MDNEFTGQYSSHSHTLRQPIYVGDLVTLSIPRKNERERMIVFKVIKEAGTFKLEYVSGPMHEGHPGYKQDLYGQVYKVIGNEKAGIDENLLE